MARKPNYDFEKRRKELDRKAKKDEKLRRKREQAAGEEEPPRNTNSGEDTGPLPA